MMRLTDGVRSIDSVRIDWATPSLVVRSSASSAAAFARLGWRTSLRSGHGDPFAVEYERPCRTSLGTGMRGIDSTAATLVAGEPVSAGQSPRQSSWLDPFISSSTSARSAPDGPLPESSVTFQRLSDLGATLPKQAATSSESGTQIRLASQAHIVTDDSGGPGARVGLISSRTIREGSRCAGRAHIVTDDSGGRCGRGVADLRRGQPDSTARCRVSGRRLRSGRRRAACRRVSG